MKYVVLSLTLAALLLTSASSAQMISMDRFVWDQAALTAPAAASYTYRLYLDNALVPVPLTPALCVGSASPFSCSAPLPVVPMGTHTVQVTAGNIAGESPKSVPVSYSVGLPGTPSMPANPRVQ